MQLPVIRSQIPWYSTKLGNTDLKYNCKGHYIHRLSRELFLPNELASYGYIQVSVQGPTAKHYTLRQKKIQVH
jgi:hypothetical protein